MLSSSFLFSHPSSSLNPFSRVPEGCALLDVATHVICMTMQRLCDQVALARNGIKWREQEGDNVALAGWEKPGMKMTMTIVNPEHKTQFLFGQMIYEFARLIVQLNLLRINIGPNMPEPHHRLLLEIQSISYRVHLRLMKYFLTLVIIPLCLLNLVVRDFRVPFFFFSLNYSISSPDYFFTLLNIKNPAIEIRGRACQVFQPDSSSGIEPESFSSTFFFHIQFHRFNPSEQLARIHDIFFKTDQLDYGIPQTNSTMSFPFFNPRTVT